MAPLFAWTSLPWLWAIRQPTLVVAGDDDPVTPHINHRLMAALIPKARLHTIRGGGHLALVESAAEVAPVITSFLRGDRAATDAERVFATANGQRSLSPQHWSTCADRADRADRARPPPGR